MWESIDQIRPVQGVSTPEGRHHRATSLRRAKIGQVPKNTLGNQTSRVVLSPNGQLLRGQCLVLEPHRLAHRAYVEGSEAERLPTHCLLKTRFRNKPVDELAIHCRRQLS